MLVSIKESPKDKGNVKCWIHLVKTVFIHVTSGHIDSMKQK